jgi:hypothetical protein
MSAPIEPLFRRDYMLGGHAKVTIVSKRSGARYTYEIKRKELDDGRFLHFVSVLVGPDNSSDYEFLGTIFGGQQFRHGHKSKIAQNAPSASAFAWSWANLDSDQIEVWHSGSCSRCGRELTDPQSIARGLGPVCAERAGA